MRLAIRLAEDGTLSDLDLDAPEGTLAVMQSAVEGLIERVALPPSLDMYVNEEGGYTMNDRRNPYAEYVAGFTYGPGLVFFGPVLFTGTPDEEGETQGVAPQYAEALRTLLRNFRA